MQAYFSLAFAFPGQKLHPIGSDAGVALAESTGQLIARLDAREIFPDDQEVVSAGVCLDEGDHGPSAGVGWGFISVMLTPHGQTSM
jgi:hypothetical protein